MIFNIIKTTAVKGESVFIQQFEDSHEAISKCKELNETLRLQQDHDKVKYQRRYWVTQSY